MLHLSMLHLRTVDKWPVSHFINPQILQEHTACRSKDLGVIAEVNSCLDPEEDEDEAEEHMFPNEQERFACSTGDGESGEVLNNPKEDKDEQLEQEQLACRSKDLGVISEVNSCLDPEEDEDEAEEDEEHIFPNEQTCTMLHLLTVDKWRVSHFINPKILQEQFACRSNDLGVIAEVNSCLDPKEDEDEAEEDKEHMFPNEQELFACSTGDGEVLNDPKEDKDEQLGQVCAEKNFTAGPSHGTTVLWLRVSPTHILVAVDSRETQMYKALDPNLRDLELLNNDDAHKFAVISGTNFLTLVGDSTRCWGMVSYVQTEIRSRKLPEDLSNVVILANEFFYLYPRMRNEVHSTIFICGWLPREHRLGVMVVGDEFSSPIHVTEDVFGSGSGSVNALNRLRMSASKDIHALVREMLTASVEDIHTGGLIRVHSIKTHGVLRLEYERALLSELCCQNGMFHDIFFDGKSMLVVVVQHEVQLFGPADLEFHLRDGRICSGIPRTNIRWLGFTKDSLIYSVTLSSSEICDRWFAMCPVSQGRIRFGTYTNLQKISCRYALTHANQEILQGIWNSDSFEALTQL